MNRIRHIFTVLLVALAVMISFDASSEGRIRRITQGIFLYSNWDAPHLTLDTCLDMTITEARIPDNVTWYGRKYPVVEIGPGAFRGCRNLMVLDLGNNAGGFLKGALLDCPNLRVIKTGRCEPPELNSKHPFYGCTWDEVIEPYHTLSTIIVVPKGCEEAYRKAPGWKEFKVIQSHMPDGSELKMDEIDVQINNLESELRKTQEKEQRLLIEIEALQRARATYHQQHQ